LTTSFLLAVCLTVSATAALILFPKVAGNLTAQFVTHIPPGSDQSTLKTSGVKSFLKYKMGYGF
jgi:hypothetical protein